ncbi:MD-2-related lipid-recognition protein-like [Schistocerca nitens]|uniref:MD-2-related lipid-recognition protein-like n=2 Tax=Schistocerca TaxID=7008 RepID=UPI002119B613|nr:MD-2-related lipid-recognition protein-like [Schistocerca nitens]
MAAPGTWLVLVVVAVSAASAEVVSFGHCPEYRVNGTVQPRRCSVQTAMVHPCKEASSHRPCKVRQTKSAGISFTYTTESAAEELLSQAFWHSPHGDLPFLGMDTHACRYTHCPAVPGARGNYTYNLNISRAYPTGVYDVMWKLWGKGKPSAKFECCFIVQIKITSPKAG